jgi:hypothetical protein
MRLRQLKDFYFYNRKHTRHFYLIRVSDGKVSIPLYRCKGEILDRKVIFADDTLVRVS